MFTTKGISTSMKKYFYVVQALPEQTADRIPALLQSPPAGNPYQALKNKLISMYNLTNFQCEDYLTALPSTTAYMPLSELFDRMSALLSPEEVNRQGFLFIHVFLKPSVGNSATGTTSTMTGGEPMPGPVGACARGAAPLQPSCPSSPAAARLQAASAQSIPSWGQRMIPFSFTNSSSPPHHFTWDFNLAKVNTHFL